MSNVSITPQRATNVRFVGPYMLSGSSILTKSINLQRFQNSTMMNQAGVHVVALADSTSQRFVETAMKQARLIHGDNFHDGVGPGGRVGE